MGDKSPCLHCDPLPAQGDRLFPCASAMLGRGMVPVSLQQRSAPTFGSRKRLEARHVGVSTKAPGS